MSKTNVIVPVYHRLYIYSHSCLLLPSWWHCSIEHTSPQLVDVCNNNNHAFQVVLLLSVWSLVFSKLFPMSTLVTIFFFKTFPPSQSPCWGSCFLVTMAEEQKKKKSSNSSSSLSTSSSSRFSSGGILEVLVKVDYSIIRTIASPTLSHNEYRTRIDNYKDFKIQL